MPNALPMDHKPMPIRIAFHAPLELHAKLEFDLPNQHLIHHHPPNRSNRHNCRLIRRRLSAFLLCKRQIRLVSFQIHVLYTDIRWTYTHFDFCCGFCSSAGESFGGKGPMTSSSSSSSSSSLSLPSEPSPFFSEAAVAGILNLPRAFAISC